MDFRQAQHISNFWRKPEFSNNMIRGGGARAPQTRVISATVLQ